MYARSPRITRSQLIEIVQGRWPKLEATSKFGITDRAIYAPGNDYYVPPLESFKKDLLRPSRINELKWVAERRMCNVFSTYLQVDMARIINGLVDLGELTGDEALLWPLGRMWGNFKHVRSGHSCNLAILRDGYDVDMQLVEPQRDTVRDLVDEDQPYYIDFL